MNPPPSSSTGPAWRVAHFQSLFFFLIFIYISFGFPNRQGLLINQNLTFLSKSPVKQCPLPGPLWRKMPVSSAFLYISFRESSKAVPLQLPLTELQQRETLHFQSPLLPFFKIPSKWTSAPSFPMGPLSRGRDPFPQPSFYTLLEAPPKKQGLLIKQNSPFSRSPQ